MVRKGSLAEGGDKQSGIGKKVGGAVSIGKKAIGVVKKGVKKTGLA